MFDYLQVDRVAKLPLLTAVIAALLLCGCGKKQKEPGETGANPAPAGQQVASPAVAKLRYVGSESCRECHADIQDKWTGSQHALAEREMIPEMDDPAFLPERTVRAGTQDSVFSKAADGDFELTLNAPGGRKAFDAKRAIGLTPLVQYLVELKPGSLQAVDMAWDPHNEEWFNVFGDEDRRPGEWGHWSGRGMNWNAMCASCHNTALRKNFDPEADTYRTEMAEMGVGCESCHGPGSGHVAWHKALAAGEKPNGDYGTLASTPVVERCAPCHARRTELTGEFDAHEEFYDHYGVVLPDMTDTWYPDGQVFGENYVYTSFIGSKMGHAGVTCMDCHDPHTAITKTKPTDNNLCMQCHAGVPDPRFAAKPAPVIEPISHGRHAAGTPGSHCVDCHMPHTTYMMRDPRRDHGFTIPDPWLTKEHGVPNACSRCHEDKPIDWVIEQTKNWYGDGILARNTQVRARLVAQARAGDATVVGELLAMLRDEEIGAWRGTAAMLLQQFLSQPRVRNALLAATKDKDPVVRAMATRSLEPAAGLPDIAAGLRSLRGDKRRHVRVEAAWALRRDGRANDEAAKDLAQYLEFNRDQPGGALQLASFKLEQGDAAAAVRILQQAIKWERNSAALRHSLAVAFSSNNQADKALQEILAACELEPDNAQFRYSAGLAHAETGDVTAAIAAFRDAVKLEPNFARGWYNLGLALNQQERREEAIAALEQAERAEPQNPDFPYALATVYLQTGQPQQAAAAAQRALQANPGHAGARQLLQRLGGGR